MPKKAKVLSPIEVSRLTKPGLHAVGGVIGLHLQVTETGARSWILRYSTGEVRHTTSGKTYKARKDAGLGGYPDTTLQQARERARELKNQLWQGVDPLEAKKVARGALLAAQAKGMTFDECVDRYLQDKSAEFGAKSKQAWSGTLRDYATPVLGRLPVAEIELSHIVKCLEPEWTTKTPTLKKVRGRIEKILDWATVRGYRKGENPARWKGNLEHVLSKPGKIQRVEHLAALPWKDIGDFMPNLRQRQGVAARCLEFIILTVARSGEARGALWSEIDLEACLWTIPAERMKMAEPHIVPLCADAITLLKSMPRFEDNDLVFPGPRGGVLSDVSVTKPLRAMGLKATVHGFRSTFRDWCAETTNYPREVAEKALAHSIPSEVERAYRRGGLLAKRTRLMADWCKFINAPSPAGEVVPMRRIS